MHKKILLLILLLAAVLRFWQLGNVPSSPDWDEAALGYNAYSILHTGRDEFGQFLPTVLRSFDDYKPAFYTYLIIPFLFLFDVSVLAVRMPAAIMGVITVGAVYYLVKELFHRETTRNDTRNYAEIVALLAAFLLAVSPWHIQFSRVAFETGVGLSFNILMALFFLKGLRNPLYLSFSVVFAALSIYTYQSEKVFTPLLMLALVIIYRKQLFVGETSPSHKHVSKNRLMYIVIAFVVGLIMMLPFFTYTFTHPEALARAKGVSIFSDKTTLLKDDVVRLARDYERKDYLGIIFDNRRVAYAKTILSNYLSHFDMVWLFVKGDYDINRHHAPGMGLEYIVFLPFLFIGMYQLIFGDFDKKTKGLIITWFLIAAIPASITTGIPHAVRTLNFLPTIQIFIALGLMASYIKMSNIKYQISNVKYVRIMFSVLVCILFLLNFSYYLNQYFVQQNYYHALDWQYGYKQVIDYLLPLQDKYDKIVVSNSGEMSQSHIFFLFYTKYDPKKYLEQGGTKSGGFATRINRMDKFEFRPFDIYKEAGKGILFVGAPADFPEEFQVVNSILYPNGKVAMKVVEKR